MGTNERHQESESLATGGSGRTGARRKRRLRRWLLVTLALVVVAAAAAGALLFALDRDGEETFVSANDEFRLEHPDEWRAFDEEQLVALPGPPLAVLRREDGQAVLVVRRERPLRDDPAAFARELDREFRKRLPDYRRIAARILQTRAGSAFYYSYVRARRGTFHAIVVVPAGEQSYVMTSVSNPADEEVSAEIGRIIGSFALGGDDS